MILGLDLSTTVCGICILDDQKEIKKLTYYSFVSNDMLEKAKELKRLLNDLFKAYPITNFYIEERLKGFRAGGTNAEAMGKTAALNFLCQFLIVEKSIECVTLNVMHARGVVFPGFHKVARSLKGQKHKDIIFSYVCKELGDNMFPTKKITRGKRKDEVVFLDEAKDMADAYVIAKCGYIKKYGQK